MLKLTLTPQRNALLKGFNNELYALLQFSHKGSVKSEKNNKPLNLSFVLDKSGSMAGEPIEEAKKAAIMMVNKLRSSDKVSVIAFDDNVETIVPSTSASDKRNIINAIEHIYVSGTTNLHGGWLAGAEQVALGKSHQSLNRVLLLSDGGANHGVTDRYEIQNQCSRLAETNVTTSTYGLGNHFNEDLMVNMARHGLGHSYYGQTSDDLMDPFKEEFETLVRTVATNLKLKFEHPTFVNCQLMNNYQIDGNNVKMPDLAENSKVWAVFKLGIAEPHIQNQGIEVLRCNLSYLDINSDGKIKGPVKLKLDPVNLNAFEMIAEDEEVKMRVAEILVAQHQENARTAARQGDWGRVNFILNEARAVAKDHEWLHKVIDSIEVYAKQKKTEEFSKEAMYSSEKMNKRLSSHDEINMSYDFNVENEKAAYLRRKMERGKKF